MPENSEIKGPTEEELEEAYDLNKQLDDFQDARENLAVNEIEQGQFPNDLFIERQVEMAEKLKGKENDPETKENLEVASESVKEAFPEFSENINLKSMLHFISREEFNVHNTSHGEVAGAAASQAMRLIYYPEDNLKETEGDHPVHGFTHEFIHMVSFSKGEVSEAGEKGLLHYHILSGIEESEMVLQRVEGKVIVLSRMVKDEQFNEFLTDYFTSAALIKYARNHPEKEDDIQHVIEQSNVIAIKMAVDLIEQKVGRKVLEDAFFRGKKEELVQSFGKENFYKFSDLLEKGISEKDDEALEKAIDFLKEI